MTALFASIWPYILSGAVALGGIVFGMFRHQQAKAATADAEQVKATAAATVAEKQSQVDQANAAASAAGEQAVVNREQADKTAAAATSDDIDAQLAALGQLRKE